MQWVLQRGADAVHTRPATTAEARSSGGSEFSVLIVAKLELPDGSVGVLFSARGLGAPALSLSRTGRRQL